jgi:hypothetical protein
MHKSPALWGIVSFCAGSGLQMSDWKNIYVASAFWTIAAILFLIAAWHWFRSKYDLTWPVRSRHVAVTSESGVGGPDWLIQELFFHLRPTLKPQEGPNQDLAYEAVSGAIKDKLSTGQIKIWGRRKNQWGDLLPLAEVPPSYWQHADFTLFFLLGDQESG